MSYSVCFNCKNMVNSYEKYCDECEKTYKQDKDFWKSKRSEGAFSKLEDIELRARELNDDLVSVPRGFF